MSYMDETMDETDVQLQNEKQRLSDTYITIIPKNTAGYTFVNQLIEVQIPKTEHVVNLAKAWIHATLQIPLKLRANYTAGTRRHFVGLMSSATMFDQVEIHSNMKTILSDTFSQVNSRIWQMSKPSHYLRRRYHSFINIDDIRMNNGFIVTEINYADTNWHRVVYNMTIPLPQLFNCFDNCESFSTTQLNDNVTLSMQLSHPERYLCVFETDANGKILKVSSFDGNKQCKISDTNYVEFDITEDKTVTEGGVNVNGGYFIREGFKIVMPAHYPTEEEKIEINNVIANQAYGREFMTTWVQAQDAQFGPDGSGNQTTQTALNYNTSVSNLYGIIMLASHNHSLTIYDKPYIGEIEMNASELHHLANGNTHVERTYDGDNDMYEDLTNVFGCQTFKNLERFDKAITLDYRYKGEANNFYRATTITIVLDLNNANDVITGVHSWSHTSAVSTDSTAVASTETHNDTDHTRTITVVWKTPLNAENAFTNNAFTIVAPYASADVGDLTITQNVTRGDTNNASLNVTFTDATPAAGSVTLTFTVSSQNDRHQLQSDDMLGCYMQYYSFAPAGQLGYSGDYFSNQINYKFKSYYHEVDGNNFTKNNYDNSTLLCCCHTLSFLIFKEGGIDIVNPFSDDMDIRAVFNKYGRGDNYYSYSGNGHGLPALVPGLIKPVGGLISKGIGALRNLVKEGRHHHNATYAYTQLGKDGYEKHKDIIEAHSTWRKRKFKKFIDGLKQMENQLGHGVILRHGASADPFGVRDMSSQKEEIAEPATFDDLNLRPFVQTISADLADIEYKNQLRLDYKDRLNTVRLRLSSFGSEAAMSANNYHGRIGDWFRKVGRKIKGWFKKDGKRVLKDLLGVAKDYAAKIATGEMKLSDIKNLKPELKEKIMELVQNNVKGTPLEGVTGDAISWYNKYKRGELKWTDIPADMIARIKELDMKEKSNNQNGIIIRHGFITGPRIKPTELYSVQKQRIKHLLGKSPMELNRRDLRRLYRFRYLKENPPIDTSHGRLADILRKYRQTGEQHIKPYRPPWEKKPWFRPFMSGGSPSGGRYSYDKKPPMIGATKDIYDKIMKKWKNDKSQLVQTEHGIKFLTRIREKMKKYKGIDPFNKLRYKHFKAKKFLRSWQDREREKQQQQEVGQPGIPAEPEHGINDYKKMKEIWKKYKKQYKPK